MKVRAIKLQSQSLEEILELACNEMEKSFVKHGSAQWGRHEFYGILQEEIAELWDCLKTDSGKPMLEAEALQVIAVILRFLSTGDKYAN